LFPADFSVPGYFALLVRVRKKNLEITFFTFNNNILSNFWSGLRVPAEPYR